MAVQRRRRGPDLVLFHGGMGWWKHENAAEVNRLMLEFFSS